MRRCSLLFLFLVLPLFAQEEIVVHLQTQEHLAPLFLAPITTTQSAFEKSYLLKLEQILAFDLGHNGKSRLCSQRPQKEGYSVELSLTGSELSVKARDHKTGSVKILSGVTLSGEGGRDRRKMHQVADAIHQALFGSPGIASTRILYTVRTRRGHDATEWVSEVWEADYDGGNPRQLTREGGLIVTPTFVPSPTGGPSTKYLYVSYKMGQPKIYATAIGKGGGARLMQLRGNQLMPVISPKLDTIAFISDVTGNPDLFVQDFSVTEGVIGKPQQIFCAPAAAQGSPTFSPDGSHIAFVSNKDGTPRIYILKVPPAGASRTTLHPQLISKKNRSNTAPAWSPDGSKIAYSAMTQGVRQIWIYDQTTGQETQLTEGPGHKENPTWAANSLHLLFNSESGGECELYLTNLNQKKAVKISRGSGEKRFPAWDRPTKLRTL